MKRLICTDLSFLREPANPIVSLSYREKPLYPMTARNMLRLLLYVIRKRKRCSRWFYKVRCREADVTEEATTHEAERLGMRKLRREQNDGTKC